MGDCVPKIDIFAKSHVMLLFMDAAYLTTNAVLVHVRLVTYRSSVVLILLYQV